MELLKKNFLVLGYVRTGTHRVKEFIRYNTSKKIKYKNTKKNSDPLLMAQDDVFFKKRKFYILKPYLDKKFQIIEKKILFKKKILSTHSHYNQIVSDFKNHNLILTIRDPVSTIASIVLFNTKKEIIKLNREYKIDNSLDLISNRKIINRYIEGYINFYKTLLEKKSAQYLKNFTIIDYKQNLTNKLNKHNFINFKIKKSNRHITSKNKKKEKDLLKKNYNFSNANKVYELFKKLHK
jgi:hypothetical protein